MEHFFKLGKISSLREKLRFDFYCRSSTSHCTKQHHCFSWSSQFWWWWWWWLPVRLLRHCCWQWHSVLTLVALAKVLPPPPTPSSSPLPLIRLPSFFSFSFCRHVQQSLLVLMLFSNQVDPHWLVCLPLSRSSLGKIVEKRQLMRNKRSKRRPVEVQEHQCPGQQWHYQHS